MQAARPVPAPPIHWSLAVLRNDLPKATLPSPPPSSQAAWCGTWQHITRMAKTWTIPSHLTMTASHGQDDLFVAATTADHNRAGGGIDAQVHYVCRRQGALYSIVHWKAEMTRTSNWSRKLVPQSALTIEGWANHRDIEIESTTRQSAPLPRHTCLVSFATLHASLRPFHQSNTERADVALLLAHNTVVPDLTLEREPALDVPLPHTTQRLTPYRLSGPLLSPLVFWVDMDGWPLLMGGICQGMLVTEYSANGVCNADA